MKLPGIGFFEFLKPSNENILKAESEFSQNSNKKFWDATNSLNLTIVKQNSVNIFSKYEKLKQDPQIISKQKKNGVIIGVIGSIISIPIAILTQEFIVLIFGLIISWTYYLSITAYYKNLAIDLVKAQIAKENNWLYDPEKNQSKWNDLARYFPEIFQKGNKDRYVEDTFWGTYQNNNKTTHFNSGRFSYTVETGSGKNRSSVKYHKNYFIFAIPKELKSRFHMFPENIGSKIGNFFSKKEINTESIEFNKTFAFSYNGKKGDQALHIVKTLSPAMQEKLIKLAKEKNDTNILFAHNTITFCFDGYMINNPKTNLEKEIKLNNEDKKEIENQMNYLIDISNQMTKYLD